MPAIYSHAQAEIVATGLNDTDLDGWTYRVVDISQGTGDNHISQALVGVTDEYGESVGYLDIHMVAEHQEDIIRISGQGVVISLAVCQCVSPHDDNEPCR